MSNRVRISGVILAVLFALLGIVSVSPAAHAATVYGLCNPNTNYAYCSRASSGVVYYWTRDISGDPNQQIQRQYMGQVSNANCWPFTCGGGNNAALNNESVWRIYNINTGQCYAASSLSTGEIYAESCNANGTNWVWDGTQGNAHLINVYQTNNDNNRWEMLDSFNGVYHPLYVEDTAFADWGMVAGS